MSSLWATAIPCVWEVAVVMLTATQVWPSQHLGHGLLAHAMRHDPLLALRRIRGGRMHQVVARVPGWAGALCEAARLARSVRNALVGVSGIRSTWHWEAKAHSGLVYKKTCTSVPLAILSDE